MIKAWIHIGMLFFCLAASTSAVLAHDSRPVSVRITEQNENLYRVQWQIPGSVARDNLPSITMPEFCSAAGADRTQIRQGAILRQALFRCTGPLPGAHVALIYPQFNPSLTSIFRVEWSNGEAHDAVLGPEKQSWTIPAAETSSTVSTQYLRLGVEHIFGGYDHLLFLLCMLFLAATPTRILWTITGFTLAHSFTLALSVLGSISLPVLAVESVIALSIVFAAVEIARDNRNSIAFQYPAIVSSAFGLLHGLGFASVLFDIGLPQTQLPLALLFFNVGIEIGQLVIIAAILFAWIAWQRLVPNLRPKPEWHRWALYPIGGLSSYWLIQRLVLALA